jgi:hypothetical protein
MGCPTQAGATLFNPSVLAYDGMMLSGLILRALAMRWRN